VEPDKNKASGAMKIASFMFQKKWKQKWKMAHTTAPFYHKYC
jgi:hypothetical protein